MPTSVKFPDIAFKFAAPRRMNTQSPLNSLLIEIDELTAQPASIYEGEDPLEVNMHGLDKVSDRTFKKFVDLQPHQKLKTRVTQAQWMMLRRFLYRWLECTFRACLQSVAKDHGRSTEGFIDSSDLLKCLPFTAASKCLHEPLHRTQQLEVETPHPASARAGRKLRSKLSSPPAKAEPANGMPVPLYQLPT